MNGYEWVKARCLSYRYYIGVYGDTCIWFRKGGQRARCSWDKHRDEGWMSMSMMAILFWVVPDHVKPCT
jgi:hypothetical protein